jgi:riboflavin transporter FmnP
MLAFMPGLNFPILPYLRFEIAELPVMVALFIYGPVQAIVSSFSYWIILNFVGEWVPIGPFMKFLSVISMIIGAWIGVEGIRKVYSNISARLGLSFVLSLAALIRILTMSVFNYILLSFLMPEFFGFAVGSIGSSTGLQFKSDIDAMIIIIIFTAIFNLLHTFLSALPSYAVVKTIFTGRSLFKIKEPWIFLIGSLHKHKKN